MNISEHTTPERLERYAFFWSLARLGVAALALFLGGIPPALYFFPALTRIVSPFLTLAWLISGAASAYLLYRWKEGGKKVFGGDNQRDVLAFFFMVVTGINLGLVPILGTNIGMSIASGRATFALAGVVYILVALYLWKRWKARGEQLFK